MEEAGREPGSSDVSPSGAPPATGPLPNGRLPSSGISILDRLIKTCPVWLQLCMSPTQAREILSREDAGVFLVTRDVEVRCMVLWVHFSGQKDPSDVLRYNIREEKKMMYLEGSFLVFEDIFKLVGFYCVSRDILPSPLRLPFAISKAQTLQDLETVSNLGSGFWDSSTRDRNGGLTTHSGKFSWRDESRSSDVSVSQQSSHEPSDCACEIELMIGSDRLWFVNPIFIEECGNAQASDTLPLTNCVAKPEVLLPKVVYRRPPPAPPSLHKPPLPSVPPSAPPPSYVPPHSPLSSPSLSSPVSLSSSDSVLVSPSLLEPLPLSPTDLFNEPSSQCSSANLTNLSSENPHPGSTTGLSTPPASVPSSVELLRLCSSSDTSPPGSNPVEVLHSPPAETSSPPLTEESSLLVCQTDNPTSPTSPQTLNTVDDLEKCSVSDDQTDNKPTAEMRISNAEEKKDLIEKKDMRPEVSQIRSPVRPPPAVPKRRPSGKIPETASNVLTVKPEPKEKQSATSPKLKNSKPSADAMLTKQAESPVSKNKNVQRSVDSPGEEPKSPSKEKKVPPVPPPRKKRVSSRCSSVPPGLDKQGSRSPAESPKPSKKPGAPNSNIKMRDKEEHRRRSLPRQTMKDSDTSLSSPTSLNTSLSNPEADSYSTSSADEDCEKPTSASLKKSHSFMLDRAKNRLSIVSISNVFSAFMSADRKLQKRITELSHDKDTYFGNLVQDYKAYSLEMMAKQSSSTEMLQEIRLMMTQLKSYLVQSTELKSMVDYSLYSDDKIDAIVEAGLCKCVLKPLKAPIECYLREIHNKDGSLRLLTENQLVIQDTTSTDLGVTTSVPDSGVMEKIIQKFSTMHKTYSPEKKITYLLKACKLIYDSMASGNPGKPHGADDFLPVLMYVLARCDLAALLLDVEFMMELMDPALQLGEGSYYLTTTYGALEHIKNYDKITVTRQLSLEVQDSIHRWERRRTLNKARVSRSSIQDFITISFEELDTNTRTLATKSDTRVSQVLQQCAEKFEVSDPQKFGLFVLVNEQFYRLADDALPHQVKASLLKNEQKLDFHFLYKTASEQDNPVKDLDFL
ncbi:ras and Rab interactor 3 isoform X2 [Hyperolius riggenbachi]|uniref:ras and Rab interactor 3 isoform X2 n=1 Tax=Hyperolius riggenbachi TaxID=752182 RepID=UPI0035A3AD33